MQKVFMQVLLTGMVMISSLNSLSYHKCSCHCFILLKLVFLEGQFFFKVNHPSTEKPRGIPELGTELELSARES